MTLRQPIHRVDKASCDARKIINGLREWYPIQYKHNWNNDDLRAAPWYWQNMILDRAARRLSYLDSQAHLTQSSVAEWEAYTYTPFEICCMEAREK